VSCLGWYCKCANKQLRGKSHFLHRVLQMSIHPALTTKGKPQHVGKILHWHKKTLHGRMIYVTICNLIFLTISFTLSKMCFKFWQFTSLLLEKLAAVLRIRKDLVRIRILLSSSFRIRILLSISFRSGCYPCKDKAIIHNFNCTYDSSKTTKAFFRLYYKYGTKAELVNSKA
jgi:hypothetical protein